MTEMHLLFSQVCCWNCAKMYCETQRLAIGHVFFFVFLWHLQSDTCASPPPPLHQCHHDGLLQQLLQNVRPQHQAGHHAGGVPGEQQTAGHAQAAQGVDRRQEEEGRDQRRQPGLQQEDPPHCLAPQRERDSRGSH